MGRGGMVLIQLIPSGSPTMCHGLGTPVSSLHGWFPSLGDQHQQPPPLNHKRAHVRPSPSHGPIILDSLSALRSSRFHLILPWPPWPQSPEADRSSCRELGAVHKSARVSLGTGWETGTQKQVPRS